MILGRCQIAGYLPDTVALEILGYKPPIVHVKIVLDILQGCLVVAHHEVGILAHDVYLLYLLLIKLVEHPVVVHLVPQFTVLDAANLHGVIENQKTTL